LTDEKVASVKTPSEEPAREKPVAGTTQAAINRPAAERQPQAQKKKLPPGTVKKLTGGVTGVTNTAVSGALGGVELASGVTTKTADGAVQGVTGVMGTSANLLPEHAKKPVQHITSNTGRTVHKTTGGLDKTVKGATGGLRSTITDSTTAAGNADPLALTQGAVGGVGKTTSGVGRGLVRLTCPN